MTEVNEDGSVKKAHKLPSKFSMFIPAFRGVDCLKGDDGKWIAGLTNPRGFVLIDKHQRNPQFTNIFAVGVCIAIPPYEPTPVPVGVPKTGYMIESMVTAAAHNIADLVERERSPRTLRHGMRSASPISATAASPSSRCRRFRRATSIGRARAIGCIWPRSRFEKYFLRKVRNGSSEPGYERFVMKTLGVNRLRTPEPV